MVADTKMLTVIPVSHVDARLAERLSKRIQELGGVSTRKALVVGSALTRLRIYDVVENLKRAFRSVEVVYLDNIRERGWPMACNDMFYGAYTHLLLKKNQEPWYFMEPDCVPLKEGWLDALEAGYLAGLGKGNPFMGVINPTITVNRRTGERTITGKHMVGTAVYPPVFPKGCEVLLKFLDVEPWDIFMQNVILKHGVEDTTLIQHNWSTCNYRRADDRIVCDPDNPNGLANPVRDNAFILHGCKDESIYSVLAGISDLQSPTSDGAPTPAEVVSEPIAEVDPQVFSQPQIRVDPHVVLVDPPLDTPKPAEKSSPQTQDPRFKKPDAKPTSSLAALFAQPQ